MDTHYTIQFYEKYIIRKINNLSKKIVDIINLEIGDSIKVYNK